MPAGQEWQTWNPKKGVFFLGVSAKLTLLLPGLLYLRQLLPGLRVVQRRVVVEQVCHEGQVELLHARDHVRGGDEGPEGGRAGGWRLKSDRKKSRTKVQRLTVPDGTL